MSCSVRLLFSSSLPLTGVPARNSDVDGVVSSMKQVEDRFNKRFRYPYVFLNEELFDENFKKCASIYPTTRIL